jgi:hypothetical protein
MRSGRSLGRECFVSGALALALSLVGCGAAVSVRDDSEIAKTKKLLARMRFKRTTITPRELGETYAAEAWPGVNQGFRPFYNKITARDIFEWEYLAEVQEKRRGFFAKQDKTKAIELRAAQKAAARERKRKAKAKAKAEAEAKKAEAAKAEAAPAAAPTSSK